jgi:anti-sigma factor RsiW
MENNEINLTDETLQRYYDNDLDEAERKAVEARLAASPEGAKTLERYRRLSCLLNECAKSHHPDDLTVSRNWNRIAGSLGSGGRGFRRRINYWLSLAAAAVLLIIVYNPLDHSGSRTGGGDQVALNAAGGGCEVESIDCTYASFMLLNPDQAGDHTIIWVNDPAD